MGPLISKRAVDDMQNAIKQLKHEGGKVLYGGETLRGADYPGGRYVRPCIAMAKHDFKIVHEETFAPILYLISYSELDEAIAAAQRRAAGTQFRDFHERIARGGTIPVQHAAAIAASPT